MTEQTQNKLHLDNGFKFRTDDFLVIHKAICDYRKKLAPIVKEKGARIIASLATNVIDLCSCGLDGIVPENTVPYSFALRSVKIRSDVVEATQLSDPDVDFSCSVVVLPCDFGVFGLFYSDHVEFRDIWFRKTIVERFEYWNDGEKPEEISDADWKLRSEQWSSALRKFDGVPSMNGFLAECVGKYDYVVKDMNMLLEYIPDFESRVSEMALRILGLTAIQRDGNEGPFKDLNEFLAWSDTPEGQAELEDKKTVVRSLLFPQITEKRLTSRIK